MEIKKIEFTVEGEPRGKERPRFANHGRIFTPEKTVEYENKIKFAYYQQCGNAKFPEDSQLELTVTAYFKIPKSTSKTKGGAMRLGKLRPTKKPDADNILKAVADALNGVCYKDEKMNAEKFYSDVPRIEVTVQEVERRETGIMKERA